jgi:CDP-paratose synthetase
MSRVVVITGVSGFLGSHLARALVASGYEVVGLVRRHSDLSKLDSIRGNIQLLDVATLSLSDLFAQPVAAVIHTATCYGRDKEAVSAILDSNVGFPLRLLEAALAGKVGAFLNTDSFFSTNVAEGAYLAAYSASKRQFVEWGRLACCGESIFFANIRLEHMYGPGDQNSKFINWLVRECMRNVEYLALTPGDQLRDFIYVDDAVRAFTCILEALPVLGYGFRQIGLGTGTMRSMRSLIELVHGLTQSTTRLDFGALPHREYEQMASVADNTVLKALGWECRTSLYQGISNVVAQYRASHPSVD